MSTTFSRTPWWKNLGSAKASKFVSTMTLLPPSQNAPLMPVIMAKSWLPREKRPRKWSRTPRAIKPWEFLKDSTNNCRILNRHGIIKCYIMNNNLHRGSQWNQQFHQMFFGSCHCIKIIIQKLYLEQSFKTCNLNLLF